MHSRECSSARFTLVVHAASEEGRPLPPNVSSDWLAAPLVPRRPLLKNLPTGTVTFLFTDIEAFIPLPHHSDLHRPGCLEAQV